MPGKRCELVAVEFERGELMKPFQTLLEKIKSMYLGVPGLPPDKITPTVGLNSRFINLYFVERKLNSRTL